ncbi:MAG: LptF/LptG family permease, partial [Acidithiobacillus sp.]
AWIATPVIILELLLALWWAPAAQRHLQAESSRLASVAAEALLQPGTFTVLPSGRVIYVGKAITSGAHRFQEIFVASATPGGQDLATAAYGEVKPEAGGALTLVLVNGQRYLGEPGQPGFKVLAFSRYRVSLGAQSQAGARTGGVNWGSAPLAQLWQNRVTPDARFAITELEWRLVWPLALPLLALLAIPLAYTEPRGGGRAAGLLLGILFLLLINNLLIFVKNRMESGMMAPFPGFLLVLLFLLAVAAYGFARRARDLPLLPSLRWSGQ